MIRRALTVMALTLALGLGALVGAVPAGAHSGNVNVYVTSWGVGRLCPPDSTLIRLQSVAAMGGGTAYDKPVYPSSFQLWSPAHRNVQYIGTIRCRDNRWWAWGAVYPVNFSKYVWVNDAGSTVWL